MSFQVIFGLLLLGLVLLFLRINAPRCFTCRKRKLSMNFTDKLDCLGCHIKHEREKGQC